MVTVKLRSGTRELELLRWRFVTAGADRNIEGPTASGGVPEFDSDRFELILEVEGRDEYSRPTSCNVGKDGADPGLRELAP